MSWLIAFLTGFLKSIASYYLDIELKKRASEKARLEREADENARDAERLRKLKEAKENEESVRRVLDLLNGR